MTLRDECLEAANWCAAMDRGSVLVAVDAARLAEVAALLRRCAEALTPGKDDLERARAIEWPVAMTDQDDAGAGPRARARLPAEAIPYVARALAAVRRETEDRCIEAVLNADGFIVDQIISAIRRGEEA